MIFLLQSRSNSTTRLPCSALLSLNKYFEGSMSFNDSQRLDMRILYYAIHAIHSVFCTRLFRFSKICYNRNRSPNVDAKYLAHFNSALKLDAILRINIIACARIHV